MILHLNTNAINDDTNNNDEEWCHVINNIFLVFLKWNIKIIKKYKVAFFYIFEIKLQYLNCSEFVRWANWLGRTAIKKVFIMYLYHLVNLVFNTFTAHETLARQRCCARMYLSHLCINLQAIFFVINISDWVF